MTILSTLKAQIADDLARSDLASQIAAAITQAIDFYEEERLFWMDNRATTFSTVAATSSYTDDPIPRMIKIDAVILTDTDGIKYGPLDRIDQTVMERLLDASASSSRPDTWSFYNDTLFFHPIPDAVYTVLPMGQIEVAGPSSEAEPNNPWMVKGFELIRCAAKGYLFLHTIKDPGQAVAMEVAAGRELAKLRRDTSKRTADGRIRPTQF